jgi:hypothetical protein
MKGGANEWDHVAVNDTCCELARLNRVLVDHCATDLDSHLQGRGRFGFHQKGKQKLRLPFAQESLAAVLATDRVLWTRFYDIINQLCWLILAQSLVNGKLALHIWSVDKRLKGRIPFKRRVVATCWCQRQKFRHHGFEHSLHLQYPLVR